MKDIWHNTLSSIKNSISSQIFNTWFKPIKLVGGNETSVELEVPNRFFLEWLKENYTVLILQHLWESSKREYSIVWRVGKDKGSVSTSSPDPAGRQKKGVLADTTSSEDRAASETGLSKKYTFNSFVIGSNNEFAHAACFAVANHLSNKYNPLFLYGGAGLGKTHLLQAMGNMIISNNPSAPVYYYTSERFTNEFISSVKHEKMTVFKNKLRGAAVLLIDDVQFWAGKEGTQEEFFHTFNTLYESHRQIVLSSDRFPKDITGLDERLRSRLAWGLIADIQPPPIEVKIAILKKKAEEHSIVLSDDVVEYLASVSSSNIRELEGYLIRVGAVSSLSGKEINLNMVKDTLKNIIVDNRCRVLTIEDIQKAVANFFNINISDLRSKRRHNKVAAPRQIAMYMAREYTNASFPVIGESFGGKDHSTVIYAYNKLKENINNNYDLRQTIQSLKNQLDKL